jgi:hypothetical protein
LLPEANGLANDGIVGTDTAAKMNGARELEQRLSLPSSAQPHQTDSKPQITNAGAAAAPRRAEAGGADQRLGAGRQPIRRARCDRRRKFRPSRRSRKLARRSPWRLTNHRRSRSWRKTGAVSRSASSAGYGFSRKTGSVGSNACWSIV